MFLLILRQRTKQLVRISNKDTGQIETGGGGVGGGGQEDGSVPAGLQLQTSLKLDTKACRSKKDSERKRSSAVWAPSEDPRYSSSNVVPFLGQQHSPAALRAFTQWSVCCLAFSLLGRTTLSVTRFCYLDFANSKGSKKFVLFVFIWW